MIQGYRTLCPFRRNIKICTRYFSSSLTKTEAKKRRNELFEAEKKSQRSAIGRIEKIKVIYVTSEDEVTMLMNKNLSTPHDCAKHVSEGVADLSALAFVDDVPWDMHRPFTGACKLKLSTMKTPMTRAVNNAFWRTCSFMLGAVVDNAFQDDITCHLHSFTSPNIKSGSFVYDAQLALPEWTPTSAEMKVLSSEFTKLIQQDLPIERLEVDEPLALEMFQDNPFKSKQIPDIAKGNNEKVTLYRMGEHVDISKGPMVGNSNIVGRFTMTAIHKIEKEGIEMLRFQGVALPRGVLLNHYMYGILEERAKKLNQTIWMPRRVEQEAEGHVKVAAKN
ncbi:39S ribosomal protein L39, mitochondrial [Microplitis mediator]|uniref:39S ribosomal protein L39, mitochondrial n=1 Tax=Microplitis mediator TaxID=375433 RepID=UPI0025552B3E|nr:39S ribosomal protein L39, mitochondrial [Microplitis mediator]